MHEVTGCEVCGNHVLRPVINLGRHPLPDDLVAVGSERVPDTYPVEVLFCERCKTAHQRFQVPREKLFPSTYHYRARQTQDVLDGMKTLVDAIALERPIAGLKVLDVGCNDGSLLSEFARRGADTFGIEPTDAADDARAAGHVVTKAFFDRKAAHEHVKLFGYPDIITFTNVFAHIEDLPGLLDAVHILRKSSTWIVIENHYLGSVIARNQFDTFYHEHPRTYSATSFEYIAENLGMHIGLLEFPVRYGGNIRVILKPGRDGSIVAPNEELFGDELAFLNYKVKRWRDRKAIKISQLFLDTGPVACAAFPGRAAILMRLLGVPDNTFDAVYEKPGSRKIGYYVPGTHVSILSDANYDMWSKKTVVNMAWHIPKEIEANWHAKGFTGSFLPIVEPSDFN